MPPMKTAAKKAPGKPQAPKKPSTRSKTGNSACSQAASNWQLAIRGKAPLDPDTYSTLGKCRAMARSAKSADDRARMGYNLSEQGREAIKGRLQKRFDQGLITQKSRQDRLKTLLAQRKEKQATAATQAKAKSAGPKKELSKEDYLALAMSRDLSEKRFGENKKAVASQAGFPNHPENDPKLQAMTAQQRIEYRNGKEYQDAVNDWHNKASKTQEEWGQKAVGARVISRLGSVSKVSGLTQTNGGTSATLRDGTVLKVTNFGSTAQWGGYQIMPPRGSSERKSIIQKRWDERKPPAHAPAPAPAPAKFSRGGQLAPGRGTEERASLAKAKAESRRIINETTINVSSSSFYHQSYHPEKRAKRYSDGYTREIQSNMRKQVKRAKTANDAEVINDVLKQHAAGMKSRISTWANAESRTASYAVTGRGNFNASRNSKRIDSAMKKQLEITDYANGLENAVSRALLKKSDTGNTITRLAKIRKRLERRKSKLNSDRKDSVRDQLSALRGYDKFYNASKEVRVEALKSATRQVDQIDKDRKTILGRLKKISLAESKLWR